MRKEVKPTNLFESVKSRVPVPLAAERYGVQADRKGRCRCPFHPDKTPSMQLNKTYYYCFGCHCTGDVIILPAGCLACHPWKPRENWLPTLASIRIRPRPPPRRFPASAGANRHGRGKADALAR